MISISNGDAATLRRLLTRLQGLVGNDTNSKNVKRQAAILARTLDKKMKNNGKARTELLRGRH